LGQADATKERRKAMFQDSAYPKTTKRQRNHAPAALLRLGALAQRLTHNAENNLTS